jgi:carboxymethylenebutenolidase
MSIPIDTQWISVPSSGGAFDAYVALPPAGHGPGLVLFQEIFGVNAHIRAVAEQYALDGFVVLAPDIFWRQAPRIELGYAAADRQRGIALAGGLKPEQMMLDLRAAVDTLRDMSQTAAHRIGAFGYCMGGRLSYMAAALTELDAAVAFYGGGIHDQLHLASGVGCPMMFHYAENDDHIPLDAVERVREAFAGKPAEVHVYGGTAHGFNCWERGSYDAQAAALAHARTLGFFASHLFQPRPALPDPGYFTAPAPDARG